LHPYRVFTLEEANIAVPELARLTAEVQERLDDVRQAYDDDDAETSKALEAETRALLTAWQQSVLGLGAEPKGIFTVDFRSPDPNVLWCWTASEPEISHRHFTWESFKDRVSIEGDRRTWPSTN